MFRSKSIDITNNFRHLRVYIPFEFIETGQIIQHDKSAHIEINGKNI